MGEDETMLEAVRKFAEGMPKWDEMRKWSLNFGEMTVEVVEPYGCDWYMVDLGKYQWTLTQDDNAVAWGQCNELEDAKVHAFSAMRIQEGLNRSED